MTKHCLLCITISFKLFCFTVLALLIYNCFRQFRKDEDVSLIKFRTFHQGRNNLYPSTTMCFYNPFLQSKLWNYAPRDINITSYSQFLQGKIWDERMLAIPYDNVTISIEDYLLQVSGKLENGTFFWLYDHEKKHSLHYAAINPPYYTSFRNGIEKCFSFDMPYLKDTVVWSLFLRVKTDIFPNGVRYPYLAFDGTDASKGGFKISFHYPKQRFRSLFSLKYQWPEITRKIQTTRRKLGYYMQFRIRGIEVLNYRYKNDKPCDQDWKNDDLNLAQKILHSVGCRPPQWNVVKDLPLCLTKEKLYETHIKLKPTSDDFLRKYNPPCHEVEKLQYEYTEGIVNGKNRNNLNREWFQIQLYYADTTFKFIKQVRIFLTNYKIVYEMSICIQL